LKRLIADYLRGLRESASPHTHRAYAATLADLDAFLRREGVRKPREVTHRVLRGYLAELGGRGLQRASIARALAAVRSFTRWLARTGRIEADVGRALRARAPARPLPKHLAEDEVGLLIDAARTPRDTALLETLYGGGLRVAECVGLDVGVALGDGRPAGTAGSQPAPPRSPSTAPPARARWTPRWPRSSGAGSAGSTSSSRPP